MKKELKPVRQEIKKKIEQSLDLLVTWEPMTHEEAIIKVKLSIYTKLDRRIVVNQGISNSVNHELDNVIHHEIAFYYESTTHFNTDLAKEILKYDNHWST